eukprot:superscaffoldBa00003935_g17979
MCCPVGLLSAAARQGTAQHSAESSVVDTYGKRDGEGLQEPVEPLQQEAQERSGAETQGPRPNTGTPPAHSLPPLRWSSQTVTVNQ